MIETVRAYQVEHHERATSDASCRLRHRMFSMLNTSVFGLHESCDYRQHPFVQQISVYGGSRLLAWLRLPTSGSTRFGAVSPTQLCERFLSVMVTGVLGLA